MKRYSEVLKNRLIHKEQELQINLSRLERGARADGESDVRDSLDDATAAQGASESSIEGDFVSKTLTQVRDAMHRLETGTYGKCTTCGRQIESHRLELVPWTPCCLEDQTKLEPPVTQHMTL